MKALSIRGPWWWFILNLPAELRKDVENRDWDYDSKFRGECLIHASSTTTLKEYKEACAFAAALGVSWFPDYATMHRGGIVGIVRVLAHVKTHRSRWFTGPTALVLEAPYPLPFRPCLGALGFFEVPIDEKIDKRGEGCLQTSVE